MFTLLDTETDTEKMNFVQVFEQSHCALTETNTDCHWFTLADPGGARDAPPPPRPNTSSFSCSFREKMAKYRLAPPLGVAHPSKKSWIRQWFIMYKFDRFRCLFVHRFLAKKKHHR